MNRGDGLRGGRSSDRPAPPGGLRRWVRNNRELIGAYIIFVALSGVGFGLVLADWSTGAVLDPINRWTAASAGFLYDVLGGAVTVSANQLSTPTGRIAIAEGCNSVYVTIIFIAAVAAFPTSWRKKLLGIVLGTAALFAINLLRVISLLYLSGRDASLFEEAHLHIWQFAIILIGGLLWLLWYDKVVRRPHVPTL